MSKSFRSGTPTALAAEPAARPAPATPATFHPYIPAHESPPEITLRAVVIGIAIGVVYGAANAYLGLLAGQTVSASLPAAVIGMFLLSAVFKARNVLENNIVQTIGSSGESLAAGVIFTVPALIFLGERPSLALIFALAGVGGLLGMLFMIPLRRYLMVREHGKLAFPEGVACAEILKAGEHGGSQFGLVMRGISVGAIYRFVVEMFQLWNREFTFTFQRLHRATVAGEGMPALLGVGMIVGPKIATLMFAGGFLGWMIILPLLHAYGSASLNPMFADQVLADMTPAQIWSRYLRYVGAGAVAVGGLMAVLRSAGMMTGAFAAILRDLKGTARGVQDTRPRTERDLSSRWLVAGSAAAVLFLWMLLGPGNWRALVGTGVAVGLAFFFVAVSAYICGQVGSSASPVSGMTISALLVTCLIFLGIGWTGPSGMIAAMTVGAVMCIAICMSGDMAQDLKTGFLLGATPWRQQTMNVVGNFAAAATIGFVLYFLHTTKTIGSEELPAPQATLMSLIVQGLFGGNLPWTLVLIGMGIGVASELARINTLPFAIGIYLPFSTSTAMFIGGIVAWFLKRAPQAAGTSSPAARIERGVLVSSGLVAGDAIIGLLTIGLIEIARIQWGITPFLGGKAWEFYSLLVFLGLACWLYRTAAAPRKV
jgi:putative OPT family oligopeptide transporter